MIRIRNFHWITLLLAFAIVGILGCSGGGSAGGFAQTTPSPTATPNATPTPGDGGPPPPPS